MGRFLTSDDFIAQFGETEAQLIAGNGAFNSLEGSQINTGLIDKEIAFVDELIAGYVLARHDWLRGLDVGDVPHLLKGLGGDIVRYRLRDKKGSQGQITDTVETRYRDALKALANIGDGKLELIRDRRDGADLGQPEIPDATADLPAISGGVSQASDILKGY